MFHFNCFSCRDDKTQGRVNLQNRNLGKWGEKSASQYLERQGIQIIAQNVRTPHGEIDLIGKEGKVFVFFEIKTRRSKMFGHPEISINQKKRDHLISSALAYMSEQQELDMDWRIDVVAISIPKSDEVEFHWFKNAITN